jgi:hypothetical protein
MVPYEPMQVWRQDDLEKKEHKHWLDHASFYNALAGFLLAAVLAVGTYKVDKEAAEDRKLQWRPVISLDIRASPSDDHEPLGLFLENAGKGPARLEGACEAGAFDVVIIDGLRQSRGPIRPGAVVAAGATIPLLTYTPEPGRSWTDPDEKNVLGYFEQGKQWKLTVYYSSLYSEDGCFQVRRTLLNGEWKEQAEAWPCGDFSCRDGEKPAR